jgi:Flp pilus assembly protein TadD
MTKSIFALLLLTIFITGCAEKVDTPAEFIAVAQKHERDSAYPEAAAAYKLALDLDPRNPTAWYDLGVAYSAIEEFPLAIDAYTKAIELDDNMAEAFNNRAAIYARLKQFDKAIADCDRATNLNPNDYLAWRNLGLARHDNGELDKAASDYDESIRINGRSAETYHYRGNVFLDQEQWTRALEDFDQAILLDENMSAAWLSRAITLARLGRAEEAEESRAKAEKLGSNVDDVVIADLIPNESADPFDDTSHHQAVEFVRAELSKQQPALESADAPWDLVTKSAEPGQRYLVRILKDDANDTGITFSAKDLEQIQQQAVQTTLVIVREASDVQDGAQDESNAAFTIVKMIENWSPDTSKMQPVVWSLPLSEESAKTPSEPVVSATSAQE